MENPTFRLEGIVRSKSESEDFEGPLALILLLLNKNKIEIRDIKISVILEQYLAYLDELQKMDLEIASEFVSMASQLLYIKTKSLLVTEEELTELESLMLSLEELKSRDSYAKIKGVIDELRSRMQSGSDMLVKPQEYLPPDMEYRYKHEKEDLVKAMLAVFSSGDTHNFDTQPIVKMPVKQAYSASDKSQDIIRLLKKVKHASVRGILLESKSRSELVAAFVALLDLCKSGEIMLEEIDGDIKAELAPAA